MKKIISLAILFASTALNAAVQLNTGSNNIDVIWRKSANYLLSSDVIISPYFLLNQVPFTITGRVDNEVDHVTYSEYLVSGVASFGPQNQLDSLALAISLDSNASFSDLNVYFNLSISGSNSVIRTLFTPTGGSGSGSQIYLTNLPLGTNDPQLPSIGLSLTQGNDYRVNFGAWVPPGGPGSISGKVIMVFDREVNASDSAILAAIPEPSTYGFISCALVFLFTLQKRRYSMRTPS